MMTSRAVARRSTSADEPAASAGGIWRYPVWPRLPGGAAADRGRRALRRSDARRLGQPREQSRDASRALVEILDPALAALVKDLRQRRFARTDGRAVRRRVRPHAGDQSTWRPRSLATVSDGAGRRRIRGGGAIGATDPEGGRKVEGPRSVADIHATVLTALGIDPAQGTFSDRPTDSIQRGHADRGALGRAEFLNSFVKLYGRFDPN